MRSVLRLTSFLLVCMLFFSPVSEGWEMSLPSLPSLPSMPSWLKGDEVDRFSRMWDGSMKKLDSALGRLDNSDSLPDERLILNDKSKNEIKIDSILQEVVTILTDSETGDLRKEFSRLQADLAKSKANLASLKEKRVSAPESGGLLKKSKDDLSLSITEEEEAIKQGEKRLVELEREMAIKLKEEGVSATDEQIRGLLAGVTADDVAAMYAVYGNIRLFSDKLTELMEQGKDDLSVARRYYGIYSLLLRTCVVMNESFIEKIEGKYLPDLEAMAISAKALREDLSSQAIDRSLSARQRQLVQNNIESTDLTIQAIGAYWVFLEDQRDQATKNLEGFRRDYSVAHNAYRTMKLARGLLDMVKANKKDFDAMSKLEVPEVAMFSNEKLRLEFKAITEGLKR